MGNCVQKEKTLAPQYSNFCPLRIATINADIDESINKRKKIQTLVEYFMRSYYDYRLDVMCIQGIRNFNILKEIIKAFKKHVIEFNEVCNNNNYETEIYLEYYPDIDTNITDEQYWSSYGAENEIMYHDKLIISRYSILQSFDIPIGTDKKYLKRHDKFMATNGDSDEVSNMCKYIQAVNLNVDGTYVSIYNIELEDDTIGISNKKERYSQLQEIKNTIDLNHTNALKPETRQYMEGDATYISTYRNIHIIVGSFHINEIKNGTLNTEYKRMITLLSGLDVNKLILCLRKDTTCSTSNIRFTKDIYTIVSSNKLAVHHDMMVKSQHIFNEHKFVAISSNITKNHIDMGHFTNYPEDTIIMLYRPNKKNHTTDHIEEIELMPMYKKKIVNLSNIVRDPMPDQSNHITITRI